MAEQNQHNNLLLIQKESAFGTQVTVPTDKFCDSMEVKHSAERVEIADTRHGHRFTSNNDSWQGRKVFEFQTKGMLTASHEIFIQAMLQSEATLMTPPDDDPLMSYTVTSAYNPTTTTLSTGAVATGAVVTGWEISKSGGYIMLTIDWVCQELTEAVSISTYAATGVTNFNFPEYKPCLWAYSTCALLDSNVLSSMVSYSITGSYELLDDDASFQNNVLRQRGDVCGLAVSSSGKVIYDTVRDKTIYDNLWNGEKKEYVSFYDEDESGFDITMYGQYSGWNKPNEKKCVYQSDYTFEAMQSEAHPAITIEKV